MVTSPMLSRSSNQSVYSTPRAYPALRKIEETMKSIMVAVQEFFSSFDLDRGVDSAVVATAALVLRLAWITPSIAVKLTCLAIAILQGKVLADRQESRLNRKFTKLI